MSGFPTAAPGTGANLPDPVTGAHIAAGAVGPTQLASTAVTAASYGDATHVGTFTVDADGRLTAAASVAITAPAVTLAGDVTGAAGSNTVTKIQNVPVDTLGGIGDGQALVAMSGQFEPTNIPLSITGTAPIMASAATGAIVLSLAAGSFLIANPTGNAITAIAGGTTGYLVSPGIASASAVDVPLITMSFTGTMTLNFLTVRLDTAPGAGNTITFTVRLRSAGQAWADTAAVRPVTNTTTFSTLNGLAISLSRGDQLGISAVQSALSVAAGISVGLGITN